MLVIKIKVAQCQVREVAGKNGKREFGEQVGFIEADDEVRKVLIPIDIEEGQAPYPIGSYTLSASSFQVGKYNRLEVNPYRIALQPVVPAQTKAA